MRFRWAAGTETSEWRQECLSHRKIRVISKREISLCAKPSKFLKISLKTKTEQPSSNTPCCWAYSWSLLSPPLVWAATGLKVSGRACVRQSAPQRAGLAESPDWLCRFPDITRRALHNLHCITESDSLAAARLRSCMDHLSNLYDSRGAHGSPKRNRWIAGSRKCGITSAGQARTLAPRRGDVLCLSCSYFATLRFFVLTVLRRPPENNSARSSIMLS